MAKIKKSDKNLKTDVYDAKGKVVDEIHLPPEIFAVKVNPTLIAQSVRVYQANQRLGTHKTKTRAEVIGSTRKIYRQKGTGRARHGDIKAPIFVGGGVAHGPKPNDYSLALPKKMRRLALFGVLTNKLTGGKIKIIDDFEIAKPQTRQMMEILKNLQVSNVLLVLPEKIQNIILSARNIERVDVMDARLLNSYEVLKHQNILFMKEAIPVLSGHFLDKKEKRGDLLPKEAETPKVEKNKKASKPKPRVVKKKAEKKTK
jgi:large subunit ribosomal protein L4